MRFTIILRGTSCQQCQGLQWTGSYCFISSQREDSRVSFPTDRLLLHIMFSILAWPLHSWDYCELLLANFTGCSLDKDMAPQPFRVFQCNHMHSEAVSAFSNDMDHMGLAATSMDSSASFQDKDIVLLSLVASASSLVLEVTGACAVADSLRSPVSATLEIVTGVKLPLEAFDAICKPLTLMVPVGKSLNRL